MRKSILLMLGILILVSLVVAQNNTNGNDTEVCDSEHLELCMGNQECEDAGGYWYNDVCNEEEECTDTCQSLEYECGLQTICDEEIDCGTCNEGYECIEGVCAEEIEETCSDLTNMQDCEANADCKWKNGDCKEKDEEDEGNETGGQGLGQTIRNRVKAGVYTSPTGEQIRVRELAQNRYMLQSDNISAECECELEEETQNNKTKFKAMLSNGRKAEIKYMPDTAAERALNRLRLRVCSEDNNCSIELKEVGNKLTYELQAERHARVLAMFRAKMQVKAEVDAETGELIRVKKPWWAFLAVEPEE